MLSVPTNSLKNQQGIATILVVMLVGLALTATSLGMLHSLRSNQEKQVAVHASTHAQNGVWVGVEALRLYLESIPDTTTLEQLGQNFDIDVSGLGQLRAENVSVTFDNASNQYRVSANIVNTNISARSSATVGVVYAVDGDDCPGCVKLNSALNFHDDLDVGGDITFNVTGTPVVNVDGDINMLNVSITVLGELNTTGNVHLDSNVSVDSIYSNGDVTLTGAAVADKVTTQGNFTTAGGAGATVVWADGTLNMVGTTRTDVARSASSASVSSGGAHGNFVVNGAMTVSDELTVIDSIEATGSVTLNHESTLGSVVSEGNFNCPSATWGDFTSISINGAFNACDTTSTFTDKANAGASNAVTSVPAVPAFNMPQMTVDVWELRTNANYIIEYDSSVSRTKITVSNVNGVSDGVYYLGNYASGYHNSYLCTSFSGGTCSSPALPLAAMCLGHSIHNTCLSYDSSTHTWTFDGISAAPGIMWFDGNVYLNNGTNYTSVLASGHVSTGGQFRGYAVNYAGYDEICLVQGNGVAAHMKADYVSRFATRYPTNLCDMGSTKYLPIDVGNIAIAAGGYDPDDGGSFSGGNVNLAANNEVYGIVLAGNYLNTGGSTKVFGHIAAANQGTKGVTDNILNGNTTVDLSSLPSTYDPNIVPEMTNGSCPNCGSPSNSVSKAKMLWSRYL